MAEFSGDGVSGIGADLVAILRKDAGLEGTEETTAVSASGAADTCHQRLVELGAEGGMSDLKVFLEADAWSNMPGNLDFQNVKASLWSHFASATPDAKIFGLQEFLEFVAKQVGAILRNDWYWVAHQTVKVIGGWLVHI